VAGYPLGDGRDVPWPGLGQPGEGDDVHLPRQCTCHWLEHGRRAQRPREPDEHCLHGHAGTLTHARRTVEVEGQANPDMPKSRMLQCMNQASDRAGEPRWQHRISRRAAGLLLTVGIFAMSFAVAGLWSPAVNVTVLILGFVSLVSGVILTRRLRPRRLRPRARSGPAERRI
jgi:hypothetical protein